MEKYLLIYNKSKTSINYVTKEIEATDDDNAILKAKGIAKNTKDLTIMKPKASTFRPLLQLCLDELDVIYTTKTGKVKPGQIKFDTSKILMALMSMYGN